MFRDNEIVTLSSEEINKVLASDLKPVKDVERYWREVLTDVGVDNIEAQLEQDLPNLIYSELVEVDGELYVRSDVESLLFNN